MYYSTFVPTKNMLKLFHFEMHNTEKTPRIANFDKDSELFELIIYII